MGLFDTAFNQWTEEDVAEAAGILEAKNALYTPDGQNRLQIAGLLGDESAGGEPSVMALQTNDRILSRMLGLKPGFTNQAGRVEFQQDGSEVRSAPLADTLTTGLLNPPQNQVTAREQSLEDSINRETLGNYWRNNPDVLTGFLSEQLYPNASSITPEALQNYWDNNPLAAYQSYSAGYGEAPLSNAQAWDYVGQNRWTKYSDSDPGMVATSGFAQQITDHLRDNQSSATLADIDQWFDGINAVFSNSPQEYLRWEQENPDMAIRFHAQAAARGEFAPPVAMGSNGIENLSAEEIAQLSPDEIRELVGFTLAPIQPKPKTDASLWGEGFDHTTRANQLAYQLSQENDYGPDGKNDGRIFAPDYSTIHNINSPEKVGDFWKIGTPQSFRESLGDRLLDNLPTVALQLGAYAINPGVGGFVSGRMAGDDIVDGALGALTALAGAEFAEFAGGFFDKYPLLQEAVEGGANAAATGALEGDLDLVKVLGSAIAKGGKAALGEAWNALTGAGADATETVELLKEAGASEEEIAESAFEAFELTPDDFAGSGPIPTTDYVSLEPDVDLTGSTLDQDLENLFADNPDLFSFEPNLNSGELGLGAQTIQDRFGGPDHTYELDGKKYDLTKVKTHTGPSGKTSTEYYVPDLTYDERQAFQAAGWNTSPDPKTGLTLISTSGTGQGQNFGQIPSLSPSPNENISEAPQFFNLVRPDVPVVEQVQELEDVVKETLTPEQFTQGQQPSIDLSELAGGSASSNIGDVGYPTNFEPSISIDNISIPQLEEIASSLPGQLSSLSTSAIVSALLDIGIINADTTIVDPTAPTAGGGRRKAIAAAIAQDPSVLRPYLEKLIGADALRGTSSNRVGGDPTTPTTPPSPPQTPGDPGSGDPGGPSDDGGGSGDGSGDGQGGGSGGGSGGSGGTGNTPITNGLLGEWAGPTPSSISPVQAAKLGPMMDYASALRSFSR